MYARIVSIILWLVQRFLKKKDDPQRKYEQDKVDNGRFVEEGDADAINIKLDRSTDRMPNRPDSSDSE